MRKEAGQMATRGKIKVLFVGETWIVSKFHIKGFDVVPLGGYEDFSVWFQKGLGTYQDLEVFHMPNHMAMGLFPSTLDTLREYDVLVLSDVGRNTLTFYPDVFRVPMGTDRLTLIRDFVQQGGGLLMCGGWMSFQGFRGMANYHGSPVEEALPVSLCEGDDRVETPEGVKPEFIVDRHPIVEGIPKDSWPLFLGYNRLHAKEGAAVLARVGNDAFIVVWEYGRGRAMAFASDLAPHWGSAFVNWEYYPKFWYQSIQWLAGKC
jgi:uncharacterized membrane protein